MNKQNINFDLDEFEIAPDETVVKIAEDILEKYKVAFDELAK